MRAGHRRPVAAASPQPAGGRILKTLPPLACACLLHRQWVLASIGHSLPPSARPANLHPPNRVWTAAARGPHIQQASMGQADDRPPQGERFVFPLVLVAARGGGAAARTAPAAQLPPVSSRASDSSRCGPIAYLTPVYPAGGYYPPPGGFPPPAPQQQFAGPPPGYPGAAAPPPGAWGYPQAPPPGAYPPGPWQPGAAAQYSPAQGGYPPPQHLPARPPGGAKPPPQQPNYAAFDVEAQQAAAYAAAFAEEKVRSQFIRKVRRGGRLAPACVRTCGRLPVGRSTSSMPGPAAARRRPPAGLHPGVPPDRGDRGRCRRVHVRRARQGKRLASLGWWVRPGGLWRREQQLPSMGWQGQPSCRSPHAAHLLDTSSWNPHPPPLPTACPLQNYVRPGGPGQWLFWTMWAVSLVTLIVLMCSTTLRRKHPWNLLALTFFTLVFSVLVRCSAVERGAASQPGRAGACCLSSPSCQLASWRHAPQQPPACLPASHRRLWQRCLAAFRSSSLLPRPCLLQPHPHPQPHHDRSE